MSDNEVPSQSEAVYKGYSMFAGKGRIKNDMTVAQRGRMTVSLLTE